MSSLQQVVHDQTENLVLDGTAVLRGAPETPVQHLAPHRFITGLATAPATLQRMFLGIGAQLVVPPGAWAVVHLPGGVQRTYGPGSYWLWGEPGAILVQWVDARRQQIPVGPIEGWSADKWRVRLWMVIDVAVSDPQIIAAHREPINALISAARAALLHYVEQHSHAALTGLDAGAGGIAAPAQAVLTHLRADSALDGLEIISARLVERQGDERQIEAATAATVAAAQIDEERRVEAARHRARLHELEAQVTINEREHHLRMASAAAQARERLLTQQAEVQQATLAARLEIVMAQIRAQTAEIAHDEQIWQVEQQRMQQEWELIQQRQLQMHQTDQQVRLLNAQQGLVRAEGELALAATDRQQTHLLQLAEMQERLAEHRTTQVRLVAERREQHERTLLELHLRHDELVVEQMQKLEQWRIERNEVRVQQQRQHDRQLAGIVGTAQIAAAAAQSRSENEAQAVADAGLRLLQDLAE